MKFEIHGSRNYFWMMFIAGLTIGAIAGLSKTSVSATLAELIVVFVSGSAGIYFLAEKREGEDIRKGILESIGYVGLAFLVAFWAGYIPTTVYRFPGEQIYVLDSQIDQLANMQIAEYYAHGKKLGIDHDSLLKNVNELKTLASTERACTLNVETAIPDAQALFRTLDKASQCKGMEIKEIMKFFSKRFENAHRLMTNPENNDTQVAKGREHFQTALDAYLGLIQFYPEFLSLDGLSCVEKEQLVGVADEAAGPTFERLRSCSQSRVHRELLNIRATSRAYTEIWGQEVLTDPEQRIGLMESLRNEK